MLRLIIIDDLQFLKSAESIEVLGQLFLFFHDSESHAIDSFCITLIKELEAAFGDRETLRSHLGLLLVNLLHDLRASIKSCLDHWRFWLDRHARPYLLNRLLCIRAIAAIFRCVGL